MRIRLSLAFGFLASACAQTTTAPDIQNDVSPRSTVGKTSAQNIRMTDMLEETLPSLDYNALAAEDARRLPQDAPRYAVPMAVAHAPVKTTDAGDLSWRMRIRSPGAQHLSFGFSSYRLPHGATLDIYNDQGRIRTFTDEDNQAHGQLWTPILHGDEAVIELFAPAESAAHVQLFLSQVNVGYRGFAVDAPAIDSGSCNVDVVCAEGNDWRNEIRSVAVIGTGGGQFCSGFLVNSEEGRQFFMTAYHCNIRENNAPSLVTYWNYETTTCGGSPNGKLDQFSTGATYRAGGAASDFTLVELNAAPNPDFNVYWAGWNATGVVSKTQTGIHHPACDEKRISHDFDAAQLTGYGTEETGPGDHWRIVDWNVGTTEPGSSGSGLWDENHRIIGQLHGGGAACGNDESDWYGAFHVSFDAGLQPYLAPSGKRTIDGRGQCDAPSVAINIAPNPAQAGEQVSFTSTVSGGQAPYTYAWDTDGDGQADCTTADCVRTFHGNVSADARLKVTDATGCAASKGTHLDVVDPACPAGKAAATDLPKAVKDKTEITSTLSGADRGKITSAKIWVNIKHSYRGDLRVWLVSPSGKQVELANHTGGSAKDLVIDGASLTALTGEASQGTWTLHVADDESQDEGSLEAFSLEVLGTCQE